jgi:drug/metabolite transporter (DMT)-like permease
MRNDSGPLPMLVAAAAIFLLSVMDAVIKGLSSTYGTLQIVHMRYLGGAAVSFLVVLALRSAWPSWRSIRANAVRALFMITTALSFFYSVSVLPLAEAVALSFMAPLFMALIARWLLGEPIRRSILIALLLGLSGVALILQSKISLGVLDGRTVSGLVAALTSAVAYAFAMVLVRRQTATDSVEIITFLSATLGWLLLLPVTAFVTAFGPGIGIPAREYAFVSIAPADIALIASLGILGTGGHLLLTWAYARANAARLAVLEYTAFIWAGVIGVVLFKETPSVWTFAGTALIIAGCLVAARPSDAKA